MKYAFLNDTKTDMNIHPASSTTDGIIPAGKVIVVEVPDDSTPFIKVWDHGTVLLSYSDTGIYD